MNEVSVAAQRFSVDSVTSTFVDLDGNASGDIGQAATLARARRNATIDRAVYAYLQAMRGLGRMTVHSGDVAAALGLPHATAERSIARLRSRGVRKAR